MQPFTDDVSALLAISRPFLREAVAGHVVIFDAERSRIILAARSPSLQLIACSRRFAMGMPHFYASARALFIPPIFFGLACDRWRFRIFDLDPKGRSPGAIGRANPFRHDALAT